MKSENLLVAELFPLLLVAALLLLGAAIFGWLRRLGKGGTPDRIQLLAARGLGGKRLLTLVEVDGERLLLGLSDGRIDCLVRLGEIKNRERPATGVESPDASGASAGRSMAFAATGGCR